jgi:hypothetical protein
LATFEGGTDPRVDRGIVLGEFVDQSVEVVFSHLGSITQI